MRMAYETSKKQRQKLAKVYISLDLTYTLIGQIEV